MVIYLSFLYLLLGVVVLLISLTYIELSRPRDLIKAGLNLIIALILFVKKDAFDNLYSSILIIVITMLLIFYVLEISSIRWNQLTIEEKNKLKTLVELKRNFSTLTEAISLARKDFLNTNNILKFGRKNEDLNKKKWVRNVENDNINTSNQKYFTDIRDAKSKNKSI